MKSKMKIDGTCPVTGKTETVVFDALPCGDNENPNLYIKGLMSSCSVRGFKACPHKEEGPCPIYQSIPQNFHG